MRRYLEYRTFKRTCPFKHIVDIGRIVESGHASGHLSGHECPDNEKGIDNRVNLDNVIVVSKIKDTIKDEVSYMLIKE